MDSDRADGKDTAGRHLARGVPVARVGDKAAEVLATLPGREYATADVVYVTDKFDRLLGVIPLSRLLAVSGDSRVADVMTAGVPFARPDQDQEEVALLAVRHGLPAVPVVDDAGRFLGVVPGTALLRVLWREHTEDIHRLAGVLREGEQTHSAVEAPPWTRASRRLPWLLVGVTGGVIATAVMAQFERILESRLAVAFFIPAIVYLADAVGTQTEAIVVRYLSGGRAPFWRLLRGELLTGLLIGTCLGLVVFPLTLVAFGDARLAAAVAASVAVAGLAASGVGLVLPWLLSRAGRDPAFGSGPVATIIQDVLSLLIYFAAVTLIVT
jgi:magnesium transporter